MSDTGWAGRGWAGKQIMSLVIFLNIDLASCEDAIADRANPLIIERIPLPHRLGCFQDGESFVRREMGVLHG